MILDLRQFEDFPARAVLKAERGALPPYRDDVVAVESISFDVAIQKAGEEYFCQADMKAVVRMECARCLSEFSTELSGKTDFIVCSEGRLDSRRDDVYDDEDYVFLRGTDLRADITHIVNQTLVLATSIKPICSEECKGLCPSCGANRNVAPCDCSRKRIDGRWAGLADLAGNDRMTEKG
jgi:uncharacterized protein